MSVDVLNRLISPEQLGTMRAPIFCSRTFPRGVFTSQEFFELERTKIFGQNWMAVCFADAIPVVGDVLPMEILGQPIFAVHSADGVIRVFHNVCPYDGCSVVSSACNLSEMVVEYHGWRYSLEGKLTATPYWNGCQDEEVCDLGEHEGDLAEIRSDSLLGVVFIHQGRSALKLRDALDPIFNLLGDIDLNNLVPNPDSESLRIDGRTVAANWKTYLENAGINVLHESFTHASYKHSSEVPRVRSDGVKTYFDHIDGALVGLAYRIEDFVETYLPLPFPHIGRDSKCQPEYGYFLTFYPNLVVTVMPTMLRINICLPIAPDSTRLLHCSFIKSESRAHPAFQKINDLVKKGFHEAYREDGIVIEAIQRGRASPESGSHFYAPFWDEQHYHFNQLLLNDIVDSSSSVNL